MKKTINYHEKQYCSLKVSIFFKAMMDNLPDSYFGNVSHPSSIYPVYLIENYMSLLVHIMFKCP